MVAHSVFSLKRSTVGAFVVTFRVLGQKKYVTGNNTSEVVPVRGEKHFKPHLLNRTLVPPRVFFKISDEHPVLYIWEFLQGHSTEIDYIYFN